MMVMGAVKVDMDIMCAEERVQLISKGKAITLAHV